MDREPNWKENAMNTQASRIGIWVPRLGPGLAVLSVCAAALISSHASSATASSITRRIDVPATPAAVWSLIGPFCSIADWHPAVGSCVTDGKNPPTRTLVTKDGKVTFVEPEIGRS